MKIDVTSLVERALENDNLKDLLEGKNDFNIPNQSGFLTDKDVVLYGGIYDYYKKFPEKQINKKYEETLIEMLNGELFDILNSLDYAFMQILSENMQIAPFKLSSDFYEMLRDTILKNMEELKQYREYEQYGANLQNAAYEYAQNLNKISEEEYGHKIL